MGTITVMMQKLISCDIFCFVYCLYIRSLIVDIALGRATAYVVII